MITTGFQYPPFANAERVVEEFRNKASKCSNEILAAYDDQGVLICENEGTESQVMVPEAARGHWLMHSHPNCAAPLSPQDLMVCSDWGTLMNMSVAGDGTICWSRGFVNKSREMCMAVDKFLSLPNTQELMFINDLLGGEEVGGTASNWFILEFFSTRQPELIDLYVQSGSDSIGYNMATQMGVKLPREFTWTNDKINLTNQVIAV